MDRPDSILKSRLFWIISAFLFYLALPRPFRAVSRFVFFRVLPNLMLIASILSVFPLHKLADTSQQIPVESGNAGQVG